MKSISCDEDCRYLDNLTYQKNIEREKELRVLLKDIPHGQFDDLYRNENAAVIAYEFERYYAEIYAENETKITDQIVKETLYHLYLHEIQDEKPILDDLFSMSKELFNDLLMDGHSKDLVGKVLLRMIISINSMTGGRFGQYGYLNYLKNNILTNVPDDEFVIEDKHGKKKTMPIL